MIIEKLDWDSDYFGIKVGKVIIVNENDIDWQDFKKEALAENFELVYVFKIQNALTKEALLKAELELVDIHLTMSKTFNREEYLNIPYCLKTELAEKDLAECYKIAEETSIVSRFYKEKKIGELKTKSLYCKWIDNALNKTFSDGLFVVRGSNSIAGIHLIKTDDKNKIGFFTLTGVNPRFKRNGIGKKLWTQSFAYWANEKEIELIKSPFSIQNLESFNFHLKLGFNKIEEIKYIYHYRKVSK